MSKKVLLAGESWMSYTTHVKGFDAFYTSTYETGEKWLKAALEARCFWRPCSRALWPPG